MNVTAAAYLVNHAHAQLAAAQRLLYAALNERAELPGRQPGECGTPAGYRRHLRATDSPCWACVDAHTWAKRRQSQQPRTPGEQAC